MRWWRLLGPVRSAARNSLPVCRVLNNPLPAATSNNYDGARNVFSPLKLVRNWSPICQSGLHRGVCFQACQRRGSWLVVILGGVHEETATTNTSRLTTSKKRLRINPTARYRSRLPPARSVAYASNARAIKSDWRMMPQLSSQWAPRFNEERECGVVSRTEQAMTGKDSKSEVGRTKNGFWSTVRKKKRREMTRERSEAGRGDEDVRTVRFANRRADVR